MKMLVIMLGVIVVQLVLPGMSKYINDIHGNTFQVDKSTGFHVLELHGMTAGVTSSLFIGALAILCASYFCYKAGLSKLLRCCCSCWHRGGHGGGSQGAMEQHPMQNYPVMASQAVQQPQPAMPNVGVGQFGTLDLPKALTFKMVQ